MKKHVFVIGLFLLTIVFSAIYTGKDEQASLLFGSFKGTAIFATDKV